MAKGHPCAFDEGVPTAGDSFTSAGGLVILGLWLTGFALTFALITGKEGKRGMMVFWIFIAILCLAFFGFSISQEVYAVLSDNMQCK